MKSYELTSGEYKGRNLREVLFLDPVFLARYYNRVLHDRNHHKKNAFILAMEDLMDELRDAKSDQICPICKEKDVKLFLVPEFNGLKKNLVCCSSKKCQNTLLESAPGQVVGIHRFFVLLGCLNGHQRKILTQIFQTAYPPHHLMEELS